MKDNSNVSQGVLKVDNRVELARFRRDMAEEHYQIKLRRAQSLLVLPKSKDNRGLPDSDLDVVEDEEF